MLDLRIPTGWFFALAGLILLALGVVAPETRAPLTDVNVNLYCGFCMVIFGGILLVLSWRSKNSQL
jgi:hypothetical protein